MGGGGKKSTIARGETRPVSTVVISSNFPTKDQQRYVGKHDVYRESVNCTQSCDCCPLFPPFRYASRCLMIEFLEPPVSLSLSDYMKIVELWKKAGSCAAFCIRLGHLFFTEGVTEVDDKIQPLLRNIINDPNTLSPRVLPSYAILYWFALKVYCLHEVCSNVQAIPPTQLITKLLYSAGDL